MPRKYGDFKQPLVAKALTKSMTAYLASRLNNMWGGMRETADNDELTTFDLDATEQAMRIHSGPTFTSSDYTGSDPRNF